MWWRLLSFLFGFLSSLIESKQYCSLDLEIIRSLLFGLYHKWISSPDLTWYQSSDFKYLLLFSLPTLCDPEQSFYLPIFFFADYTLSISHGAYSILHCFSFALQFNLITHLFLYYSPCFNAFFLQNMFYFMQFLSTNNARAPAAFFLIGIVA